MRRLQAARTVHLVDWSDRRRPVAVTTPGEPMPAELVAAELLPGELVTAELLPGELVPGELVRGELVRGGPCVLGE